MRLNQSRRGLIGYTYSPQVYNDITQQVHMKTLGVVQDQAFEQGMIGAGHLKDVVVGMMDKKTKGMKQAPEVIDAVVKGITFLESDKGASFKTSLKSVLPNAGNRMKDLMNKYSAPSQYSQIIKQSQEGQGLGVAGAGHSQSGGYGKMGRGMAIPSTTVGEAVLPGDLLKKKLLSKMMRERKTASLGDRRKTTSVGLGVKGGALVTSGQSRSKTLPSTKPYKLNPRPIVGAGHSQSGGFIFTLAAIIAGLSAAGASAAAAASAVAATTIVGSVTVGSLAGAALTAGVTGAAGVIGKKLAGGKATKKQIVDTVVKAAKKLTITLEDFTLKDKVKLKAGFEALKKNPTKSGIIALGKKIAPLARDIAKVKLHKELGMSGSGMRGMGMTGAGAKKFDNTFVKEFASKLTS